jgi:DNA-nicking Smr family endonuclease
MTGPKQPRHGDANARGRGSLKDQLRALPGAVAARAPAPPARPAPLPAGPSFKELAGWVAPLSAASSAPGLAKPAPVDAQPAAPVRPPRPRLWVEQRPDVIRARDESVPPKLLAELEAGRIVPRRQVDLHRLSAAAARQLLDVEVKRARRDGVGCILVVCGRGVHSGSDGPVLPDVAVERLSEELAFEVLAFATAPRKWGGLGALLVLLRPKAAAESSEL